MTETEKLIERLEKEAADLAAKARQWYAEPELASDVVEAIARADGMMAVLEPLKALLRTLETSHD